jgi:hypothetical protein
MAGPWIALLVLAAVVAVPLLFVKGRRALIRLGELNLAAIEARARRHASVAGLSSSRVTIKYHTYTGLLVHAHQIEHVLELPRPVAEATLKALLRHNLTWGSCAEGVLIVPVLACLSYLGQKRSIRRQAAGERAAAPRAGPSRLQIWGEVLIVVVLINGFYVTGMREVREYRANRTPLELACGDVTPPSAANRWVRLSGATGALADSAVRFTKGVPDRVYVPLTCGESPAGPVRVVLATDDRALVGAIAMHAPEEARHTGAILAVTTKPVLRVARQIEGMVRTAKDHETGASYGGGLAGGGCRYCPVRIQSLAPDYLVIEEHKSPSLVRGLAWLTGAFTAAAFVWRRLVSIPRPA